MRVPLADRRIGVPEDLLHVVKGVPGVDEERRELVPEIVDAYVRQARRLPEPRPHLHDRGVRLPGALVDEDVREPARCPFDT